MIKKFTIILIILSLIICTFGCTKENDSNFTPDERQLTEEEVLAIKQAYLDDLIATTPDYKDELSISDIGFDFYGRIGKGYAVMMVVSQFFYSEVITELQIGDYLFELPNSNIIFYLENGEFIPLEVAYTNKKISDKEVEFVYNSFNGQHVSYLYEEPLPEENKSFELHFIDVGMGDAMLLICDGEAMIIDSGNVGYGETVVNYAKDHGVTELKYLLVTHGHADHVGGMPEIIDAFPFETMFLFNTPCSEEPWQNLISIIEAKNIEYVTPAVGSEYTLGSGTFKILTPYKEDTTNLNNNSIGIKFFYGERSFLLLGDIQSGVENQLLKDETVDLTADVFKADHHGSSAGCIKKFLEAVTPIYTIITVGENNKYGYPDKSTVSRLEKYSSFIYRTDVNGSIVVKCDGEVITVESN